MIIPYSPHLNGGYRECPSPLIPTPPLMVTMKKKALYRILAIPLFFTLTGCSNPKPVIYPNAHLQNVGNNQAQQHIDFCMAQAKQYGTGMDKGKDIGKRALTGAAIGAATSAAVSAVLGGNVGRAAGAGAAGGAAAGTISGAAESGNPGTVYKNYVNRCLQDRGYDVIGWQ